MIKTKYLSTVYFLSFLLLTLFVFRSLAFHITTNLPDWRDYALSDWIMHQNIEKITTLNFSHYFDTNAFYPNNKYSLLFADTFIPESLIQLPFWLITKNIIFSFNIAFFITLILNYFSSYLLWKKLFKSSTIAFFGGLLVSFSPFFHIENGHFQMLNFWPFFLSLYFLFKGEEANKNKYFIFSGIFLAIEFLASVYTCVFLLFSLFVYHLIKWLSSGKLLPILKQFLIIMLVFLVLDGVFIKSYGDMKHYYNIKRDFREYVIYSANLSDYIFTSPINSVIHKSHPLNKWNSYDHNNGSKASFPGFLIFFLSLGGLIVLKRDKSIYSLKIILSPLELSLLIISLGGFIFSLGPRLIFNGTFAYIPTPYALFLKFVPFLDAIRAVVRWSFLFYFGLIFFSLVFLKRLETHKYFKAILIGIFLIIILEYVPMDFSTHAENYINGQYAYLKTICDKQKLTLLEIPVTHLSVYPNIVAGVNYISKVELSSTYHGCYLANGYSGYDMPAIFNLQDRLNSDLYSENIPSFIKDVKQDKVNIVKINTDYMQPSMRAHTLQFMNKIATSSGVRISNGLLFIK